MGGISFPQEPKNRPRGADGRLPELAARQHGLVTAGQLAALGFAPGAVKARLRAGRLHRVHRGVYAIGHSGLAFDARCLAAVMAVGRGAVVSHRPAAALWGLIREPPEPFDVTTPFRTRVGLVGVVLHRVRCPPPTTRHRGVPVTTVPQTLLDLAASVPERQLERVVREAHARWLVRPQLLAFVDGAKGRPGAPALRRVLGRQGASRSAFERRFLALCRRHRLEPPLVNEPVAGQSVDFFWPAHRLVVETDGYATHATRDGFEHDRRLDAHLARAGVRVLRFTWRQLDERPSEVVDTLHALGLSSAHA